MTAESASASETAPSPGAAESRALWNDPRAPLFAAVALALLHFLWVRAHSAPATMSPDANGYVAQARYIAESGRTSFNVASPAQHIGIHWLETERGLFHSRYPAGLPVIFAAAWKLGGFDAVLWVNPLLASATVLLVFFLARRLAGAWPAVLAAAVVAAAPTSNQHALDADAHIAATFFLVAGVSALLRFGDTWRPAWGVAAGVLLGIVPTIRYPEAIVALAIVGWLLARARPVGRAWPAVAGALLPLLPLCIHNAAAYDAFWRTGYALTNEQTGFGFEYFTAHAVPYLQALGGQGLGLFFAFGVAGLVAMAFDRARRSEGLLFTGIVVPLVLVYMAYYFGGGGGAGPGTGAAAGNLRFLVPTFPFLAIAGVWLLARLAQLLGTSGRAAMTTVGVLQLLVAVTGSSQVMMQMHQSLATAAQAREVAEKDIPAGSVVIVERTLAESFDAVGRWRLVDETLVGSLANRGNLLVFGGPGGGLMGVGGPPGIGGRAEDGDAPSPQQAGKNIVQQERYHGLAPNERRARVWADIVAWAGDKPIYWFARSIDQVRDSLPDGGDYRSIAEVDAPVMGLGGGGGRGGPIPPAGMGRGGPGGSGGRGNPPGMGPPNPGGRGGFAGGPGGRGGRGMIPPNGAPNKLRVVKLTLPKV